MSGESGIPANMEQRIKALDNRNANERDPKKQGRAIQPGEYFPWKGFMFQVTEVTKDGFTAKVTGVTKRLAHLFAGTEPTRA